MLEKNKILGQFLDILGANSGNIIMINSLYYTYKIFAMTLREPLRLAQGKAPTRGGGGDAIKSMEKDIKMLSRFFVQAHLFIKVHMIYKRLIATLPGLAFVQLAKLYHAIGSVPACKTLVKDMQRNPEYRDGVTKICNMFDGVATSALLSPLSPSPPSAPNSPSPFLSPQL